MALDQPHLAVKDSNGAKLDYLLLAIKDHVSTVDRTGQAVKHSAFGIIAGEMHVHL